MPKVQASPLGLATDPARYGKAPQGGLTRADNVAMRRQGVLEPRPGWEVTNRGEEVSNNDLRTPKIASFGGDVVVFNESTTLEQGTDLARFRGVPVRPIEAGGSLYVQTRDGVVAQRGTGVTDVAGLYAPTICQNNQGTIGAGTSPAGEYKAAYRTVFLRTVDGREVRSAPSNVSLIEINAGSPVAGGQVQVIIPHGAREGDRIELYRAYLQYDPSVEPPLPSDEMFLVTTYILTAADLATGTVWVEDGDGAFTDNDDLLTSLYTNASQEGALQENGVPVPGKAFAIYQGSLFSGNASTSNSILTTFSRDFNVFLSTATNVTITSGSPTISGTWGDSDPAVGMLISDVGAEFSSYFPQDAYVISVTNTAGSDWDVTFSANATASAGPISIRTGPGVAFINQDTGAVISRVFTAGSPSYGVDDLSCDINLLDRTVSSDAQGDFVRGPFFARVVGNDQLFISRTDATPITVGFYALMANPASPQPIEQPIPEVSLIDGGRQEQPGTVYWSKEGQFEAFPPVNFAQVGDPEKAIVAMEPAENALYIFKEDGIFSLTGFSATTGWSIQPLDVSRILHPWASTNVNDSVFVWTEGGVLEITASSLRNISTNLIGDILRDHEDTLPTLSDITTPVSMAASRVDNEIYLAVADSTTGTEVESLYVYNRDTLGWVRWDAPAELETVDVISTDRGIALGGRALPGVSQPYVRGVVYENKRRTSAYYTYDEVFSTEEGVLVSGVSIAGTTATIQVITLGTGADTFPFRDLAAGDRLVLEGEPFTVESLTSVTRLSNSLNMVVELDRAPAIASTTDFQAATQPGYTIQFVPLLGSEYENEYRIQQGDILFGSYPGVEQVEMSFDTPDLGVVTSDVIPSEISLSVAPQKWRFWVPRNAVWSWGMEPRIVITGSANPGRTWEFTTLSLELIASTGYYRRR